VAPGAGLTSDLALGVHLDTIRVGDSFFNAEGRAVGTGTLFAVALEQQAA
jgi:hypothetical protein